MERDGEERKDREGMVLIEGKKGHRQEKERKRGEERKGEIG